jgi:fibronectin type 3 domain-containing protein
MSLAIHKNANVIGLGAACLSMVPMALALAAGAGRLYAQNPATSVSVDANANRRAINPDIYGLAMAGTSDVAALNAPLNRIGGDLTSTYNWQLDTLNLSNDWYFESWLQNTPLTPGKYADDYIQNTRSANVGAEPMVTIPMLAYIAKLGANDAEVWSFSVAKYGAQTGVDPWNADAGNGISAATGKYIVNNPSDAYVPNSVAIQQSWLQHLLATWGTSTTANGVKYYILDNEPSIWSGTHRDVHPNPETYQELYNDIVAFATAIRAADPNAKIVGPEEWTWWAMYLSGVDQANGTGAATSDYNTHNHTYYYPWLLQQLSTYEQTTGTKLLDVLSVHCYNAIPDGSDDSASGQATRNRETRILWDPAFVDSSWETGSGINGGIMEWIPTMRNWVNQYYPGLEIGCTEYNWGDEANLNGATTQADVLGIYGREGFDLATRWTVPANPSPTYLASQIYRNYDGKLSTFGDTSVSATVVNPDNLSAFAALRSKDGALTVMVVNKQQGSTPVTISLANFAATGTAQAYQISSAAQTSIAPLGGVAVANNAIVTTVPSQSITLFVIPAGGSVSAPTAPTGLAASVGNGTVTLTWSAGGGATSYTVKRGTASGGPYTSVGTVSSPAPTTFTDTGLADGTTYYYVVSATNSAGASPNSAEVAATPLIPPTFSSSATASPNPVAQNAATTITATVTCTANSLTGGAVQVSALDPNGNTAATQTFTAQTFAAKQSHTYTLALTPALAGTYTVEIAVFSATGQQWSMNASAAAITVNSSLSFTSSATATPSTVAVGATSVIAAAVTANGAAGLSNAIVELQIFDKSGNAAATQYWSGQTFAAGQTLKYSYNWTPASTVVAGTYTVMIGVFDSTWTTDYYWNSAAATITVTGGASPPAFTSSAAAKPASISVGATSVIAASVTDTGGALSNANVLIDVYPAGSTTAVGSQTFSAQNFVAGQTLKYTSNWTPASTVPAGTYTVEIGVFDSAWSTDYYWNGNAATITVTAGTPAPAAPTGLTATPGYASVTLSWTAPAGAASYNIYRATAAGGESTTPIATNVAVASYTDSGLTNGTKYFYKVAAVNAGGTSALSTEASATPEPPAPAAPTGLTATPGNASVTLSWTAPTGAASYNIYRGTTAGGESATPIATGVVAASYTDSGLTNGTKYFYKVAALNAGGTSALSAEASATPEPPAPAAPTGLTATPGNASVTLSWTAPAGAASYNVYRGTTAGGESATPIATGVVAASYTDSGLTNGTKYFYKVAAVNAGGTSALSAEASATPEPPAPAAPTGLTATPGNTFVTLSWTAPTGAASYNVYRATAAGGESATPIATGVVAASYTNSGLTNGTKYFYKVAAVNASGTSALSAEASATPEPPAPAAPTGLTATPGNASVTLSWTAPTGAASYNVYRGTTAGGESATPVATAVAVASYTDSGLTNGTKYFYKVAAVNAGGTSALSAEASATPEPPAPAAPTGLTATPGNASVTLSWTAPTGAASYNIYRGVTAGGESATPIATGVVAASYTDSGLTNGTKYFYKVAAVNVGGTSALSAEASATPEPPAPASIAATAGGNQSAQVNTAFNTALQATVKDAVGNPVPGVTVTFAAPGSGASGKFGAAASAAATTNAQGVATAPAFTANGTAGSYLATAGVSGVASAASFALTNTAAASTTQVTNAAAVYSPASQSVSLTATVSSASAPATGGSVTFTVKGLGSATAAIGNGQAAAPLAIPAAAGAGTYVILASYSGDAGAAASSASGVLTIAKANPVLTWNDPVAIVSGAALGAAQLDATANVAGSFVYSPPAGAVLPVGNNQQLQVAFTPADASDYNSATKTVTIDVTQPAGIVKLTAAFQVTRDSTTQDVMVHLTVANSGTAGAANVQVTQVRIGDTAASGLPITLGAVAQGKSAATEVRFPASVGAPGARQTLSLSVTYTGGEFDKSSRIVLP